jgi:oligopeptide transport system ATP-binding protein
LESRTLESRNTEKILTVENLKISFLTPNGVLTAVDKISFEVDKGEVLGIVGESGAGKTATGLAIIGLLPTGTAQVTGSIKLHGQELVGRSESYLRQIRGKRISMIYQDPLTSLNPVMRVGDQISELMMAHFKTNKKEAWSKTVDLMKSVNIPNAEKRVFDYPHQFSGGMRQRIVIAMALACEPDLLIADEPTTMLDLITQSQIIDILKEVKTGNRSIIFITHDLGVVAETCDRVIIMYAGKIMEEATVRDIFKRPLHPYTFGLLRSLPRINGSTGRLSSIPGSPPNMLNPPLGCRFHPRCQYAVEKCSKEDPKLLQFEQIRKVACIRVGEIDFN